VQLCAGPSDIRKGGLGWLLKAIAWISLVIGPVLLLLLIQVQFLPYHLEWVTWVQRFAVLVDLILLWFMWPAVLNGRSELRWRLELRSKGWPGVLGLTGRYIAGLTACLVPIGLAFTAATFPGERMEDWIGNKQWIPPNGVTAWLGAKDQDDNDPIWTSFHDLLFNGNVDEVTRRRKSLFSNTLVLPAFDALEAAKIDDPKKLESVKQTLILRGRHLESALFDGADLRKADLDGAQLQGASLDYAKLQGVSLDGAQLQGVSLYGAQLQGASLDKVELQGASLVNAQLQGASLDKAELQGASLDKAELHGALLWNAQLQGASLDYAKLQGASLLGFTKLQGASLGFAQLQGASLDGADLYGASLDSAQLQGANFKGSTLAVTDMRGAAVWRANFEDASLTAVFEDALEENALSKDEFTALKAMIRETVPEGETREYALKRIEILNPNVSGNKASARVILKKGRAEEETAYQKALADKLKGLACSDYEENARYIVPGFVKNDRIKDTGAEAPGLVEAILDPKCPVSAALTEDDKAALKKLAKEASGAP
jgi:uncharacterized protein YjbI with pentapeptide repeats